MDRARRIQNRARRRLRGLVTARAEPRSSGRFDTHLYFATWEARAEHTRETFSQEFERERRAEGDDGGLAARAARADKVLLTGRDKENLPPGCHDSPDARHRAAAVLVPKRRPNRTAADRARPLTPPKPPNDEDLIPLGRSRRR